MAVRSARGTVAAASVAVIAAVVAFGGTDAIATQGSAVIAGVQNTEIDTTEVQNTNGPYCDTLNDGSIYDGLWACGDNDGVIGTGSFIGVRGSGSLYGIYGSGTYGAFGVGTVYGVFGSVNNTSGSGIYGVNIATGGTSYGVRGIANQGTGVFAESSAGTALKVKGKAVFSRSGIVRVAARSKSVQVTMSGVTTSSMILATVQQSGAFYVKSAVPTSGSFTININKAPSSPVAVAYFVLN
ncbi:MAG: hypothetical protein M3P11_11270 [Actinomycetota bacterium]|nr:hypothetical protein [Actinomycetota bacterium]